MSVLDLQGMESAPQAAADGGHSHSSAHSCGGGGSNLSLLICGSGLSVACHN